MNNSILTEQELMMLLTIGLLEFLPRESVGELIKNKQVNLLIKQLEEFQHEDIMTLLIPDRDKPQQEDFVWCLPVNSISWKKWYDLAVIFKTITPQNVRYMNRMEGRKIRTVLLLPMPEQSDDDVMLAAAWLRMVKELSCRMYVIRCLNKSRSVTQTIYHAAGADSALLEEVDDGNPSNEQDTASS